MKISTVVIMLTIIGVFLSVMIGMIQEGEEKYGVDINKSEWENEYQFAESINNSVAPIQKSILTVEDEEKGFLEKVGEGFTGIIAAITLVPRMLIETSALGGNLLTGLGRTLGWPSYIIYTLLIILIVWGVFKLIEIFQRYEI